MRKKDMQEEIARLRDVVMTQGREIVAMMRECEALREERDKAVFDMRVVGCMGASVCPVCTHYNHGAGDPKHCPKALKGEDCFDWRGVKEG